MDFSVKVMAPHFQVRLPRVQRPVSCKQTQQKQRKKSFKAFVKAPDTLLGYGIPNFCTPFAGLVPVNAGTVSIYPNPAKDQITITGVGSEYANYLLVNELGEVILKGSVHSIDGGMHVNIAGIANGWYVLKIQSSEAHFLEKVIIQH